MKILFVTSNRLGDAVLSTGLLDHLIRAHPDARITVVCGPAAEGVFARMPNRERTIVLRKQSWGRHWLPLWADVASHVWDLVVDIRGSALAWLVPTRRRAVFHRVGGPKINQLGAILGLSPAPSPVAWTSQADQRHLTDLLPIDRPIIALAPTANWGPKVWPADRFAEVFRRLADQDVSGRSRRANAVPVILGGPGLTEHAMAEPLLALLPDAVDLVGRLTLPEVVACLERAVLFIGNDSGLMHLSAATGTPTIGLFGPTDAETYGPSGRVAAAVVGTSMASITVDQVERAAEAMLDQRPRADSSAANVVVTSRPVVSS